MRWLYLAVDPLTPRSLGPFTLLFALSCSPGRYSNEPGGPALVFPARFAEGTPQTAPSSAPAASASPAPSGSAPLVVPVLTASKAPDPTPLQSAEQVEFDLELADGKIRALSVKPVKLATPQTTPRRLGRYALELSIGNELIERVRFDFPGTAADEPMPGRKKLDAPLDMSSRAVARVKLLVPHSPRVRRALLVDRALNTVMELDWPLPAPPPAAPPQP